MSDPEPVRGGMWASLDDASRIKIDTDPGGRHAEITFFGTFEVSLSLSERAVAQCHDLCAKALREMHADNEPEGRSWLHQAAPSE